MGVPLEFLVIQIMNDKAMPLLDAEFFSSVPAERPDRFVVVSRTGGPKEYITERGLFAVTAWETTRYAAGQLADDLGPMMRSALMEHPRIARVNLTSLSFYPDPSSGSPRYQLLAEITAI